MEVSLVELYFVYSIAVKTYSHDMHKLWKLFNQQHWHHNIVAVTQTQSSSVLLSAGAPSFGGGGSFETLDFSLPSYDQATSGGDVKVGEGKDLLGSFTAPTPSPSKEDDSAAKADAKEAAAAEKAAAKQAAAEKKQVSVLMYIIHSTIEMYNFLI